MCTVVYENTLHFSNMSLSLTLTTPEPQQEQILLIFNRRQTQRKFIYVQGTDVKNQINGWGTRLAQLVTAWY